MALNEEEIRQIISAAGMGADLDTIAAMIMLDMPELLEELRADDNLRRSVRKQRATAMALVMNDIRKGEKPPHGKEHWNRRVLADKSYDMLLIGTSPQPSFESVMDTVRKAATAALR